MREMRYGFKNKFATASIGLAVALTAAACGSSKASSSSATATNYPAHPITMVVPFGAGSQPDVLFRKLAAAAAKSLGQPIEVEDVAGGASQPGIEQVMSATPNGYTIGVASTNLVTVTPLLTASSAVSASRMAPIAAAFTTPLMIYAGANTPYKTFKSVVQAATGSGKSVKVAIDSPESVIGITLSVLARETHANLVGVPLGTGTEVLDVVNGTLPVGISSVTLAIPYIKSGKLRPLAQIGGAAPLPGADTTLLSSQGYNPDPNGLNPTNTQFLFAPKATPSAVIAKLDSAFKRAITAKSFESLEEGDGASPDYVSGSAMVALLQTDQGKAKDLVREFGLKASG